MRWFDRALIVLAAAFVVVLLATVTAGVVFRAVNQPLSWTDEAAGFLMVWVACLGWMIGTRRHAHIRIRVLQDKLPRGAWNASEIVFQLGTALLGGVIAWHGIALIRTNADIEAISMPLAVAWMYAPMLPAGLLTLGQALAEIVLVLRGRAVSGPSVDLL